MPQTLPIRAQKPHKVLVAEDERAVGWALELKLARAGFEITTVPDGQAALNLLKRQDFDLLLFDLVMPRLDG